MSTDAARCPFTGPRRLFQDLAEARDSGSFPRAERFDALVVSRYDDVVAALHDPTTFSSSITVTTVSDEWREKFEGRIPASGTLLGHDNPTHDRLRSAVNTFFVPRRLQRYEPWMREQAHRLVDGFVEDGSVELKTAFGLPLPLRVISHIVGLDAERAEWIGHALAFFQGDRDLYHSTTREQKAELLFELHDYIREVMEERRRERRDDLISHVWNERDAGIEMTDFEMLSLFPGLMLAGHETSSNLICMALSHLLADRSRWEWAQRDDASRARALEELVRYESAITGMTRLVTSDTTLGGIPLAAGQRVFLAYASGSRDPARFDHPDDIDFHRSMQTAHLGFGQGIHACLGAPLARILLRVELDVLHERLPGIDLAVPYEDLEYTMVSEGRGMVGLPLRWTPAARRKTAVEAPAAESPGTVSFESFRVAAIEQVAAHVREVRLRCDGRAPRWEAGAHVDVRLPNGIVRQYSIVPGGDPSEVRIAVLKEPASRGSSRYIHDELEVGAQVGVGAPRNHFALSVAGFYLFVAGGIGITPLLRMIEEAEAAAVPWRLLYLGRSLDHMAYASALREKYASKVYVWPSDERGRFDVSTIWDRLPTRDALVYACGPDSLLSAVEATARAVDRLDHLVLERFSPRDVAYEPNTEFDVEIASTGRILSVPPDRSVLEVVNEAGANVLSTCQEGTCGTCEVRVLGGIPEHRDSVLDARERLSNETMMICVSRCAGRRLVLDL